MAWQCQKGIEKEHSLSNFAEKPLSEPIEPKNGTLQKSTNILPFQEAHAGAFCRKAKETKMHAAEV